MGPVKKKGIAPGKRILKTPQLRNEFPATLIIGDFELTVDQIAPTVIQDAAGKVFKAVSGTAWLKLECADTVAGFRVTPLPTGYRLMSASLEVVHRVINPETEISYQNACRFKPDIHVGQTLDLKLAMTSSRFRDIAISSSGLITSQQELKRRGEFLVALNKVTIERLPGRKNAGRIIKGEVTFPTDPPCPLKILLNRNGFTVVISGLTLRPTGASATATLILPDSIASADSCFPAILPLGTVPFTPGCNLFVDRPDENFGPWLIGDTGMVVTGRGYTVDMSETQSPVGRPDDWMGVILNYGKASGSLNPVDSNTGYLAGDYAFSGGVITQAGLQAQFTLNERQSFQPSNPHGYVVAIDAGLLMIANSQITSGQLGPGTVRFPSISACEGSPGNSIEAYFASLTVQPDLDLWGEVTFNPGIEFCWGELTHLGDELISWSLEPLNGTLYLPANPLPSFCPDDGEEFTDVHISDIENKGISGVTLYALKNLRVFSPDRPGDTANPFVFPSNLFGWLRVAHKGVDGVIGARHALSNEPLGNIARRGYDGNVPFTANISFGIDKQTLNIQYVASAVYDSRMGGTLNIPLPCGIPDLRFDDMEFTSTAHLVGGSIVLPANGVSLDYWRLQLAPTGDPSQAGVVSVRTGRIVFTAAGISEPVHFLMPFKLTWGEILADGNLGELFIDYNNYGQKFDGLPYTPQNMVLSPYVAGTTDAYLATCGTVHLNFFGVSFVNIRDARNDTQSGEPYYGRHVTVPKTGEHDCIRTDLTLNGQVDNSAGKMLGIFDFLDINMDYYEDVQNGFIGKGSSELGMLHSDSLEAQIEIHADAIDICISSASNHDLDLGYYRVGTLGDIAGCVRLEGPLLTRISIWAALEQSSSTGFGVLSPKAGYAVEVSLDITPASLNFYASGNIAYSVAGGAVSVAASVHLLVDYLRGSAEGEMNGSLDCNSILGGLEGDGQVTWYVDASTQYLQGRLKMTVCGWAGGVGLEGGLFIGNNCPKNKAWVLLHTSSERFGVSQEILPDSLTGLYGYGFLSFGVNWYIFGGEVELFAGLGAFQTVPPGLESEWAEGWSSVTGLGLPYVVGSAGIYVSGEILGGLVSASAWADLDLRGPIPIYFEGTFGLKGCVLWVLCASIEVTAGLSSNGFYLN